MNRSMERRIAGLEGRRDEPLAPQLVTVLAEALDLQEEQIVQGMETLRDEFRTAGAIWDRHIEQVADQRGVRSVDLRARLVAMGVPL